jgi:hypothetical protein
LNSKTHWLSKATWRPTHYYKKLKIRWRQNCLSFWQNLEMIYNATSQIFGGGARPVFFVWVCKSLVKEK